MGWSLEERVDRVQTRRGAWVDAASVTGNETGLVAVAGVLPVETRESPLRDPPPSEASSAPPSAPCPGMSPARDSPRCRRRPSGRRRL